MEKYDLHFNYSNKFIFSTYSYQNILDIINNKKLLNNNNNSINNNVSNNSTVIDNKIDDTNNNNIDNNIDNNMDNNINDNNNINNDKNDINNNKNNSNNNFNYNLLIHSFLAKTNDSPEINEQLNEDVNIENIPVQYRHLKDVFSKQKADKLPPHRLTDCKIVLEKDATLHYGPIYSLTEEESKVLKEYIDENLKKGFIRPSESPAGYPVLFQKKKDGSLRLCVDYKKLNAVTVRNSYPIPLISDIIERVKGATHFTKLDLRSAYNLIRIREGDEYKTAFRTKYGHYEYLVMPFGLTNAPATFQSFINYVLRPFLEKFVILYLDDILIFSKGEQEHHKHVEMVLKKLLENNLYAKLEKCEFDKDQVEFLGYVLSGKGIATDPKKIEAIKNWPRPQSVKDVQRFVGLCNYYRRFVQNFAKLAKPLHQLTKKNVKFEWSSEAENSFKTLKEKLISSPILIHPNPEQQFIVECDASNFAIGAILSQHDKNNVLHPVAYFSRALNNAEKNYSITEKELLAIKCAFSNWRHLLLGARHQIVVYTDHRNLIYTLGGKVGNQRQHRWHLFFQEYNFKLVYRQGRKNGKPDSLSRRPDYLDSDQTEVNSECILDAKNIDTKPCFIGIVNNIINKINKEIKNDDFAFKVKLYLDSGNHPNLRKPYQKMYKFKIMNNLLFYNNLLYIPEKVRLFILTKCHENPSSGHVGIAKTEELITRNYWWPQLHKDVVEFVKTCETCIRNKVTRHKKYDFLHPLETPKQPWESIEIDFLCGLPESKGYTVIMVVVDRLTKMIHLIPFKDIPTTEETAKEFLRNIYKLHGLPRDIITDRGTQFTSDLWKELLSALRIQAKVATTDHHETVGQVERCNSFIEQYLRIYTRAYYHDDWVDWLYAAEFAYNNSINASTKQSPFYTNYGFHPFVDGAYTLDLPSESKHILDLGENFKFVQEVLNRAKDLYKRHADKKRMPAPQLEIGSKVWVHAPPAFKTEETPKLAPCKFGPYKIVEVCKYNNYKLNFKNSPFPKHFSVFHISELEPYIPNPPRFSGRNKAKDSSNLIVEIDDFRTNYEKHQYEYKIRYQHRSRYNWVPSSVIEDDPRYQDLLIDFNNNKRRKRYQKKKISSQ